MNKLTAVALLTIAGLATQAYAGKTYDNNNYHQLVIATPTTPTLDTKPEPTFEPYNTDQAKQMKWERKQRRNNWSPRSTKTAALHGSGLSPRSTPSAKHLKKVANYQKLLTPKVLQKKLLRFKEISIKYGWSEYTTTKKNIKLIKKYLGNQRNQLKSPDSKQYVANSKKRTELVKILKLKATLLLQLNRGEISQKIKTHIDYFNTHRPNLSLKKSPKQNNRSNWRPPVKTSPRTKSYKDITIQIPSSQRRLKNTNISYNKHAKHLLTKLPKNTPFALTKWLTGLPSKCSGWNPLRVDSEVSKSISSFYSSQRSKLRTQLSNSQIGPNAFKRKLSQLDSVKKSIRSALNLPCNTPTNNRES
jgi:hypothetical protein